MPRVETEELSGSLGWEVRFPPGVFRIAIDLGPTWDRMARALGDVAEKILYETNKRIANEVGSDIVERIEENLSDHEYTGRLANSFQKYISPQLPPSPGSALDAGPKWYVTVGLKPRGLTEVGPIQGRPVPMYASAMELGTEPHARPWGNVSRARVELWGVRHGFYRAGVASGSKTLRRLLGSIYSRGTRPHPYLRPATEDTIQDWQGKIVEHGQRAVDEIAASMRG